MRTRDELYDGLGAAGELREVARLLGRWCLSHSGPILRTLANEPVARRLHGDLANWVADARIDWEASAVGAELTAWLSGSVVQRTVALLEAHDGLVAHAVLSGVCRRPLRRWFASTVSADVAVEYGDPLPVVTRSFSDHAGMTPSLEALLRGTLLGVDLYRIYDSQPPDAEAVEPYLQVSLDFSNRILLDDATWDEARQCPPDMATVQPHAGEALAVSEIESNPDGWWFGVAPKPCDIKRIVRALEEARGRNAWCAVLPELSLPSARALADDLAERHDSVPRLVVAGSAHERRTLDVGREERSNRSVVYLDGSELFEHAKTHPFYLASLDEGGPGPLPEGINSVRRLRIASGDLTRLAVVICADLHADDIVNALVPACVNLLLVPALTPNEGAFAGVASTIASRNQGVTLVANGTLPEKIDSSAGGSFMCLVGIPRARPDWQTVSWKPLDGYREVLISVQTWNDTGAARLTAERI